MAPPAADRRRPASLDAVLAGVLRRSRVGIVVLTNDGTGRVGQHTALQTLPALDPARGAALADVVDIAAAVASSIGAVPCAFG